MARCIDLRDPSDRNLRLDCRVALTYLCHMGLIVMFPKQPGDRDGNTERSSTAFAQDARARFN